LGLAFSWVWAFYCPRFCDIRCASAACHHLFYTTPSAAHYAYAHRACTTAPPDLRYGALPAYPRAPARYPTTSPRCGCGRSTLLRSYVRLPVHSSAFPATFSHLTTPTRPHYAAHLPFYTRSYTMDVPPHTFTTTWFAVGPLPFSWLVSLLGCSFALYTGQTHSHCGVYTIVTFHAHRPLFPHFTLKNTFCLNLVVFVVPHLIRTHTHTTPFCANLHVYLPYCCALPLFPTLDPAAHYHCYSRLTRSRAGWVHTRLRYYTARHGSRLHNSLIVPTVHYSDILRAWCCVCPLKKHLQRWRCPHLYAYTLLPHPTLRCFYSTFNLFSIPVGSGLVLDSSILVVRFVCVPTTKKAFMKEEKRKEKIYSSGR